MSGSMGWSVRRVGAHTGGRDARGDRLYRDLREVLVPGAGVEDTGAALSHVVSPVVAHDALRLVVMNPSLGVGSTALGFWHGYGPDLGRELMTIGSRGANYPQLARLARQNVPVLVADRRFRASAYDRLLARYGVGEELCLVLRDARGVWGLLGLLRAAGGRAFDTDDRHRIAAVGPPLIAAVRGYVTTGPIAPTGRGLPPGMLVVDAEGKIAAMTPQARQRQVLMAQRQGAPDWLIEYCYASLSFEAREHARDPRRRYPRVCTPSIVHGEWTAIEAQPLGDEGDVAIVIQRATGELLVPAFCDWYGITTREQQVVRHLQDGTAPKQIARLLDLSVHTVNDHLRAIFRKTGASGRDELMAAITA